MTSTRKRPSAAKPSVVCPVDFSEASRTALRYAELVAEHFGASLTVLTVNEPVLVEAAALNASVRQVVDDTRNALEQFRMDGLPPEPLRHAVSYEVATGMPAAEILRAAANADLIVMSSHGLSGFRKLFFGSVAERVLRETRVPVLIVPGDARPPASLAEAVAGLRCVLAPVAFGGDASRQVRIAEGIANAAGATLLLVHVIEPLRTRMPRAEAVRARVERERRLDAEAKLAAASTEADDAERLIAIGEPAEEIANVARDRQAGLIVIGLRSMEPHGPRVGSVTYRVLCAAGTLVLALPPEAGTKAKAAKNSRRAKNPAARGRARSAKRAIS